MDDFIKKGYEEGWIKPLEDAFINNPPTEEIHKGEITYYIKEEAKPYTKYKVGDIVYVDRYTYSNKKEGNNHLFVIVRTNLVVDIEYFGMLISSRLEKLKYKDNILLKRDQKNNLDKDSIVKTDYVYEIKDKDIRCKIGEVDKEKIDLYIKIKLNKK